MDIKEKGKQYYLNNRDKILEKSKQYYHDNKDKILDYQVEYRMNNKDKLYQKQDCICGSKFIYCNKHNHLKSI